MFQPSNPDDVEETLKELITVETDPFDVRLGDIEGLDDDVAKLREAFIPAIASPDIDIRAPCLLVHGPEGTGKSRIARAVASELATHDFRCLHRSAEDIAHLEGGPHDPNTERLIAGIIDKLGAAEPVTFVLEDIGKIRIDDNGPLHRAIARTRDANERIAIICLHSHHRDEYDRHREVTDLDFPDFWMHVPFPGGERYAHVLQETIERLAADTAVTVEADVGSRLTETRDLEEITVQDVARRSIVLAEARASSSATVTPADVTDALEQLGTELPTARRSGDTAVEDTFQPVIPDVTFGDIGGLDGVIQRLHELVTYPQQYEEVYADSALDPASGVLLHGPPGTGKTMLAKALANETARTCYVVEGAAVKTKWFGESEERVRTLFEAAREGSPSLVFFDEFDAIASPRDETSHAAVQSIVTTLLAELDGIAENDDLLVVAATNRPSAIDPAITRSGRIGESLEVPPPDEAGRRDIFRIQIRGLPTTGDVTPGWFVTTAPNGVTGADIAAIVERAVHQAIRDTGAEAAHPEVTRRHVRRAIEARLDSHGEDRLGYY